ncbi:hypothetical protein [Edaphobacter aggregans]|uniref:hypothetical protein n=1 Tax=Edaphobacter aggregans TaxID=570835 RepID=UPI000553A9EC|nr:hypothetical protein [Edaphobacter aggregans]
MDNALASMIQSAAGNGAPTNPSSRYTGTPVEKMTLPDGTEVAYLSRRIVPQATVYSQTFDYSVADGDRLDTLAARFLGDPILYWMIADANLSYHPDELTAVPGRSIRIPRISGIPAGARNG